MNRTLSLLTLLLLVVVVAEGFYLYQSGKLFPRPQTTYQTTSGNESLPFGSQKIFDKQQALKREGVLASRVLTDTITSTVVEIKKKTGQTPGPYPYQYVRYFRYEKGGYYWGENDLEQIKVVRIEGDKEIPITIDDVKPGDKFELKTSIDITKHPRNNLVSATLKII